jgi:peptidoglycan/xylan/chitin deacetylase (PgdA/CDA1 family)
VPVQSIIRRAAKSAVLPLGLLRSTRAGDVVILLYHRVGAGTREIDLDAGAFERQMAQLAAAGTVRTLDEALADGSGGVVVSIDDGYADFNDQVLPRLVRYKIPAILYLATGLVAEGPERTSAPEAPSWAGLREAVSTGLVDVGSHTHTHADLSKVTESEAEAEMRRSKDLIQDRLGVVCRHFAYPWSTTSPEADRAARRLFDTAALLWRTNRRGSIDLFRLGRIPVLRSDGPTFFSAKVRGTLDQEALVYRALRRGPWRKG